MSRISEYIAKISPDQKYKPIKVLYWTSLTYQGFSWIICKRGAEITELLSPATFKYTLKD